MSGDKRKATLYFPKEMIREIEEQADRLDRSHSWVMQQAWKLSKNEIFRIPSQRIAT